MKFKNTSEYPDHLLKRMIGWACDQFGIKRREVKSAIFAKRSWYWRGYASKSKREIRIRIHRDAQYPLKHTYGGRGGTWPVWDLQDHYDALAMIICHEICHIYEFVEAVEMRRAWVHNERRTEARTMTAMKEWWSEREKLLAEWLQEPVRLAADRAPAPTIIQRKAIKLNAMISQLALTKE